MEPLARNGYTAEEVKRALHAPWGARQIEFRYELLDKNNQHKGWLDVEDGTLSYDALGEIHRKATLRIKDDSMIEWGVDRVKPIVRVRMPTKLSRTWDTQADWAMWVGDGVDTETTPGSVKLHTVPVNPGAETGDLTGWIDDYVSGNSIGVSDEEVHNGRFAFVITSPNNGTSPGAGGFQSELVSCTPGDIVRATAWVKGKYHFGFDWCAPDGQRLGKYFFVSSQTTDWRQVDTGDVIVPDGVGSFRVWCYAYQMTGHTYYDDVTLTVNGSPVYLRTASLTTKPIDLTSIGTSAIARINWEADIPSETCITVEVSTDDGKSWKRVLNDVEYRLVGMSTTMTIRVTLSTDNIAKTPILHKLSLQLTSLEKQDGCAEFPLGVLLLTTPKKQTDVSGTRVVEVECYDQIHILKDPIGGTYRIPKGTNIIQAVSSILTAAGITLQNLAPSDKVMPFDREWDANSTRLEIINDLLKAINYFAIYFDANGYAVARPYTLPAEAHIEYEYLDDDVSVIELGSVEEHTDFFDVPNRWVLVVSQPDVGNLRAEYVNDNPASPTSTVRRGYVRTKYMEVEAADQETLNALTRRQAEIDTSIYQHVRWSSWIMPHHGHMDTYYLRSTRDGIEGKFRETAWQMELRPGGRMTHECRRSVQV